MTTQPLILPAHRQDTASHISRLVKDTANDLKAIKVVLRAQATLAQLGLDHLSVKDIAEEIRQSRIRQITVRRYVHEMLGRQAVAPANQVRLFTQRSESIIPALWADRAWVDYLERYYVERGTLPQRVIVNYSGVELVL